MSDINLGTEKEKYLEGILSWSRDKKKCLIYIAKV